MGFVFIASFLFHASYDLDSTGVDLTPSLKKLPLCNHMLKRAMIMKRPPRSVIVKPEVNEKTHLQMLQKRVADYRAHAIERRTVACPYGCGWTTKYKYKKQVRAILCLINIMTNKSYYQR